MRAVRTLLQLDGPGMISSPEQRPTCPDCGSEIDPKTCWCGDWVKDHVGMSHNHGAVPLGCTCHMQREHIWELYD